MGKRRKKRCFFFLSEREEKTQRKQLNMLFVCLFVCCVCSLSFDLQRSKAKFALMPRLYIKREAQHTQSTLKSLTGKSFFFLPKERTASAGY